MGRYSTAPANNHNYYTKINQCLQTTDQKSLLETANIHKFSILENAIIHDTPIHILDIYISSRSTYSIQRK